ncbi:MAG: kynureninase [Thermoanaerobaculia bacterium]|nr:MAG: kynureninase [Thermoanaerobaculia bacterium]
MSFELPDLAASPNALARHYSRFRVDQRVLLSGHSHQAWPDVALEGQIEAFEDAALHVDDKWARAFARAERVREGYRSLLGDPGGAIALGPATHDLLVKLLSALPWRVKRRILTTEGEFHALRRQLAALEHEGCEVVRESVGEVDTLAERLAARTDDRTLAVFVSAVLFETARIVPGLDRLAARCERLGVPLVVDAYHALNVLPFELSRQGLAGAFVTGGGYKYLQLGEGNAFLRLPPWFDGHPALTGWFAEFDALAAPKTPRDLLWGPPASRFAGATYDPTCHYRAAKVLDFFAEGGLTAEFLSGVYRHQVGRLARGFDALGLNDRDVTRERATPLERIGGFLALESPRADELRRELNRRGVFCDHRGTRLRLGPAPYLSDAQLDSALDTLAGIVRPAR